MGASVLRTAALAQQHCDDVVVAAALFKPNAVGHHELSSIRAMSQRQLLKAGGAYFCERVLLAVTTVEVVAIALGLTGVIRPRRITWRRDELVVRVVPARRGCSISPWPAFLLARPRGTRRLELVALGADEETASVMDHLMYGSVRGTRSA